MKFIHMSDLHLGKKVNGFSMEEEQKNVLNQVISLIEEQTNTEPVDGVLIAGDVYDKNIPTVTAVTMFDDFITLLASKKIPVYIISGNHDSAERLSFGSRLLEYSNVHMVSNYTGEIKCVTLEDSHGPLYLYMLPFVRPVDVRRVTGKNIESYEEAIKVALENIDIDFTARNVIIAHQNIIGAAPCESEDIFVGGLDGVSASLFENFDYAALGHLHQPQKVGGVNIRYAGSPIKYSFSEANHKKSVSMVTLKNKGDVNIETIPLVPIHDLRIIEGNFAEIMDAQYDAEKDCNDYVQVVLKDNTEIMDVMRRLRDKYPNIMQIKYDNLRTRNIHSIQEINVADMKTPLDYIQEFFEHTHDRPMDEEQFAVVKEIAESLWEAGK